MSVTAPGRPASADDAAALPIDDEGEMYDVAPRRSVVGHLTDIWTYRELLRQLVRRELKVKYKNSTLGFAWSLLNPAFLMFIYWLVFSVFLPNDQPNFPIWILSGLLIWSFFATSLSAGTNAITGNSYLVGKVRFPREILPLASVGAALVHFFLQTIVLILSLFVFRIHLAYSAFILVVPALLVALILVAALAMLLSAVNVYARDTQHLLELLLLAWFWMTPILVPYEKIAEKLSNHGLTGSLLQINPMTSVVTSMQRAFYGVTHTFQQQTNTDGSKVIDGVTGKPVMIRHNYLPDASLWWYGRNLGIVLVISLVIMVIAIKVFDRAEGNFAEVM